ADLPPIIESASGGSMPGSVLNAFKVFNLQSGGNHDAGWHAPSAAEPIDPLAVSAGSPSFGIGVPQGWVTTDSLALAAPQWFVLETGERPNPVDGETEAWMLGEPGKDVFAGGVGKDVHHAEVEAAAMQAAATDEDMLARAMAA